MFENLRNAFSSAAKSLGEKELKEKDIDEVLFQLEISLLNIFAKLNILLISVTLETSQLFKF